MAKHGLSLKLDASNAHVRIGVHKRLLYMYLLANPPVRCSGASCTSVAYGIAYSRIYQE